MGTVLLLLVLAGWIGVGFWWFTTHQSGPSDAIGSFRAQLGTLERRTPGLVRPAHRLNGAPSRGSYPSMRTSAHRRAATQRRRRDVVSSLGLLTAATFLLGLVPALRLLWVASVVFGALLALYVYLIVQVEGLGMEQDLRRQRAPQRAPQPRRQPAPVRTTVRRPPAYVRAYEAEPALVRRATNY